MRARDPDAVGVVDRDGVAIAYEVHGDGDPTLLLIPPSPITHSRIWKAQIPFLARHYRVVTLDGRGNGRSGRPTALGAHTRTANAAGRLRTPPAASSSSSRAAAISRSCANPSGSTAPSSASWTDSRRPP